MAVDISVQITETGSLSGGDRKRLRTIVARENAWRAEQNGSNWPPLPDSTDQELMQSAEAAFMRFLEYMFERYYGMASGVLVRRQSTLIASTGALVVQPQQSSDPNRLPQEMRRTITSFRNAVTQMAWLDNYIRQATNNGNPDPDWTGFAQLYDFENAADAQEAYNMLTGAALELDEDNGTTPWCTQLNQRMQ